MTQRVVRLGQDCSPNVVSLRQYIDAWRAVLAAEPGTQYKSSLRGWWPASREEVLDQFRAGLDDRISRHLPWYEKGRYWSDDAQREMRHAANRVNSRCVVRPRDLPARLRTRLAHRLCLE